MFVQEHSIFITSNCVDAYYIANLHMFSKGLMYKMYQILQQIHLKNWLTDRQIVHFCLILISLQLERAKCCQIVILVHEIMESPFIMAQTPPAWRTCDTISEGAGQNVCCVAQKKLAVYLGGTKYLPMINNKNDHNQVKNLTTSTIFLISIHFLVIFWFFLVPSIPIEITFSSFQLTFPRLISPQFNGENCNLRSKPSSWLKNTTIVM